LLSEFYTAKAMRKSDTYIQLVNVIDSIENLSKNGIEHRARYLNYRVVSINNPKILNAKIGKIIFHRRVEQIVNISIIYCSLILLTESSLTPIFLSDKHRINN